jgi:hypothetical protein
MGTAASGLTEDGGCPVGWEVPEWFVIGIAAAFAVIACAAVVRADLPSLFVEPDDLLHADDWRGEANVR